MMRRAAWRAMRVAVCAATTLALAACAVPPQRPSAPVTPTPSLPAPAPDAGDAIGPPVALAAPSPLDDSPWPRLRRGFAMQGCDYRDEVQRWARYYTAQPRQFAASWKHAMPFLLLVVDEIERRKLPAEFAMLPYVESSYQPIETNGDRPAGIWQLVPDTARSAGLHVQPDYDERLDAVASTRATLDLLERYERAFGDWRLVNMAFNSGEFRVRKLLGERDPHALSADELRRLPFNAVTHEHLDRLLALACIIDDPSRFAVNLPEPQEDDRLRVVALDAAMDVRVAAHLAGVPVDSMQRWNAAYRRHRMPTEIPHRLLMPEARVARFEASASALPTALWPDWQERRADRTSTLANWAAQAGIPVAALAAANGVAEDTTIAPTSRLLLPGREVESADTALTAGKGKPRRASVHVVQAGDTLSRIAHRYALSLKDLKRWNPRAGGTLHLGDQVRLGLAQP